MQSTSEQPMMTSTAVVLVRKPNVTKDISNLGTETGTTRMEITPIPSKTIVLPLWMAEIYSAIIAPVDQLEVAVRLVQLSNQHLRTDYPGLVERYEEILRYQHQLYDEATSEAISIQ